MTEKKELPLWSALASYGIGYLWVCCFLFGFLSSFLRSLGRWYPLLFTGVFFLWIGKTLQEKRPCREHVFWMACSLLLAGAKALGRTKAVDGWDFLALHGFAAYWALARAGLLAEGESGMLLPLDLAQTSLMMPFGGFFLRAQRMLQALRAGMRELRRTQQNSARDWKSMGLSAVILLAAFPVFLAVGNLLSQADAAFGKLFVSLGDLFRLHSELPHWVTDSFFRFLFGLPVGAYLYGLAGSCRMREHDPAEAASLRAKLDRLRIAPMGALCTVLACFAGLYLLFFGVQAGHLLSVFRGVVPGTLTAAQYAREGFFQLCLVMAINFGLLFAAALAGRASLSVHKAGKLLAQVLMTESLFLAVTAAAKLGLYIRRFGFTPLRLLSFWAVAILTAGALLALAELRRPCKAFTKWIYLAAGSFTALCFF